MSNMIEQPRPGRPAMPASYGIAEWDEASAPSWVPVTEKLREARNYWISSTRRDGRPHAMPVWGVLLDGTVWFSTGSGSQKERNLSTSPEVVVHLESGDDVVVIEGTVEPVTDRGAIERFADAYDAKYQVRPDAPELDGITYRVAPRIAHTWLEADFPGTATRWRFDA